KRRQDFQGGEGIGGRGRFPMPRRTSPDTTVRSRALCRKYDGGGFVPRRPGRCWPGYDCVFKDCPPGLPGRQPPAGAATRGCNAVSCAREHVDDCTYKSSVCDFCNALELFLDGHRETRICCLDVANFLQTGEPL